MARTVSIGAQSFAELRESGDFLVDKTGFVRDWWASHDVVTLVCRPRRFGKTLALSTAEAFLSTRFAGRADLFEGLEVWDDPAMRAEQGAWPVVFLSFANVKPGSPAQMRRAVHEVVAQACRTLWPAGERPALSEDLRALVESVEAGAGPESDTLAVQTMCEVLRAQTGRRAVVLLDEYDTPLQEAWLAGYWDEAAAFMRSLLNSTFKTNPSLGRGLITGITRVARESIFSDLNNLEVVSASSRKYEDGFGFTQAEVDEALAEFGLLDQREEVRRWYDGFTFGGRDDIYNPWSITNYLDKRRLGAYWANTSSNALASSLVARADADLKEDFGELLEGGTVTRRVDEFVTFPDLERSPEAVWGLLATSGYLRMSPAALSPEQEAAHPGETFDLSVTNHETMIAFDAMVRRWFDPVRARYNAFVKALLADDLDAMNDYLNDVALDTFSTFDTGTRPSGAEPERFYHGFVLGLLVDLRGRYRVRSNRESGYGRYDVMLEPVDAARDPGIVMEFKVRNSRREASLEDTVAAALAQVAERGYAADLVARGVPVDRIRSYGLAFEGKSVLIGR